MIGKGQQLMAFREQQAPAKGLVTANRTAAFVLGRKIFLLALLVYPATFAWSLLDPILIGSVHLQILVPSVLLLLSAGLQGMAIVEKLGPTILTVLWLGGIMACVQVLCGRVTLDTLPLMRVLFTIPVFWALFNIYVDNSARRKQATRFIVWNCVIVMVFGIAQSLFFPQVGRETGFMGGANVYANLGVIGIIAVSTLKRRTLNTLLAIILFAGIVLAASRWAFVVASIALYRVIFRGKGRIVRRALIATCCVVLLAVIASPILHSATYTATRLLNDPFLEQRYQKSVVGFKALFTSTSRFIIGGLKVPLDLVSDGGVTFSDNSPITLALHFGVPLAVLWLAIIMLRVIPLRLHDEHKIVPIYCWGTLLLNNAILWDVWLLYIVGILVCSSSLWQDRDPVVPSSAQKPY